MRPLALASVVALVFAGGLAAGVLLTGAPQAPPPAGAGVAARPPPAGPPPAGAPRDAPLVPLPPPTLAPPPAAPPPPSAPPGPSGPPSGPGPAPGPDAGTRPPPTPGPPPPDLLAEGERAVRELEEPGDGRVTTLVAPFQTDAERAAWEERRRASWAARLAREREIKVRTLTEHVGLRPDQAQALAAVLEREGAERMRLVDLLAAQQVSRATFDEQVRANLARAREELGRLLTPEQLAVYESLAPREQVLREETH